MNNLVFDPNNLGLIFQSKIFVNSLAEFPPLYSQHFFSSNFLSNKASSHLSTIHTGLNYDY